MPMVLFYVIAPSLRWLIMCLLAKFMDPTYTVSFEKGFGLKLICRAIYADTNGYVGSVANSIHPSHRLPLQNAKYDLSKTFATDVFENLKKKDTYCSGDIGFFPFIALQDIAENEEVIVNYDNGYWNTLSQWLFNTKKHKKSDVDREQPLKRRTRERNG